jgi:hypothetical protein
MKKYNWEQEQIAGMKEYIARFGHGSAKLARQAQVRGCGVLQACVRALLRACVFVVEGEWQKQGVSSLCCALCCSAVAALRTPLGAVPCPPPAHSPFTLGPASLPPALHSPLAPPPSLPPVLSLRCPAVQGEGAGQDGSRGAHQAGGV